MHNLHRSSKAQKPDARKANINWKGRQAFIRYLATGLLVLVAQIAVLGLLSVYLSGLSVSAPEAAVTFVLVLSLANSVVLPRLISLSIRVHPLLFPALVFLLNGTLVLAAALLVPGIAVHSIWTAIGISLALSVTGVLAGSLLAIDDYDAYERFVVYPLLKRYSRREKVNVPGLVFLEIDGLSAKVLQKAIQEGYMPTVKRWLENGSHRLSSWETDLSSQTGSSQLGILHGSNFNIPAFRWYEKDSGKLYALTRSDNCAEVEKRASNGNGLLSKSGSSRANMYTGDAPETMLTFSTLASPSLHKTSEYFLFVANPYMATRTFSIYLSHLLVEIFEGLLQWIKDEKPRVSRSGTYPLIRALATGILREITLFAIVGDMMRGLPTVYATFAGYDEVAHHSGIERKDALRVLSGIDKMFGWLERISAHAARPYRLVVLSDHGQSSGATFRQRSGRSLERAVRELIDLKTISPSSEDETWNRVNALLTDVSRQDSRSCQLINKAVGNKKVDGMVMLGPEGRQLQGQREDSNGRSGKPKSDKAIVLASGNLGLIYFTAWKDRMSLEEISMAFPGLIPGLLSYRSVGFVMVRSESQGPIAIGGNGICFLRDGRIEGNDPLSVFGPLAQSRLLREDEFFNAPDLLVNSFFDPISGEVAAFEELVGSHGGIGGDQSQAILIYPSEFDIGSDPIIGAERLHKVIRRWLPDK